MYNQSETLTERIKAITAKSEEITRAHHAALKLKESEISDLKEQNRKLELKLVKASCDISKHKTLRESAEISLANYKRKAYAFANRLLKIRGSKFGSKESKTES